ncbi:sensor histidine kinase [Agromyces sp. CCNWLW203]|uniref:sensor histidine kinase n=1 Tax=Agromyces sp. CCNWLW203 TaxID=3112842 RepID=UPI002F96BE3D
MNQISERWNRISLRTKITGVTVLMLTLGLLVSGIGTAAMLRSYVEDQVKGKLEAIASGDLRKYFTDQGEEPSAKADLNDLAFRPDLDVFVAVYDGETGEREKNNWRDRDPSELPQIPKTLTTAEVNATNQGHYEVFALRDSAGNPTFRAVYAITWADNHGNYSPIILAISSKETEQLLAVYLTIFFGFGFGVVLVGALLTRMLVTTTFMPLREVERTAAAIADGDFSQRLGGATPNTEVGRLNRSLNTMLNRIDRAFRDRARTIDQMRRFVGDASHELRTPLVSVRGYAELYRMGALQSPEEVGQAMERIEKEAIRMGLLVEDLLALARLDEAKPLDLAEVDLVPLARDSALDTMAAHPARTITVIAPEDPSTADASGESAPELEVELDPAGDRNPNLTGPISFAGATLARLRGRRPKTEPAVTTGSRRAAAKASGSTAASKRAARASAAAAAAAAAASDAIAAPPAARPADGAGASGRPMPVRRTVVLAEENKIRQVITNLMGNAIRFTSPESPIEIRISVDDATERAMIEVVDHGEGIPPQIREKIFQRFWRADTSRTRETGGSGLGLAIVSSIVAAHNGTVDVVETPGGGATFRVSLPLAGSASAPQRVTAD